MIDNSTTVDNSFTVSTLQSDEISLKTKKLLEEVIKLGDTSAILIRSGRNYQDELAKIAQCLKYVSM